MFFHFWIISALCAWLDFTSCAPVGKYRTNQPIYFDFSNIFEMMKRRPMDSGIEEMNESLAVKSGTSIARMVMQNIVDRAVVDAKKSSFFSFIWASPHNSLLPPRILDSMTSAQSSSNEQDSDSLSILVPKETIDSVEIFKTFFYEAIIDKNCGNVKSYLEIVYRDFPNVAHVDYLLGNESEGSRGLIHYAVLNGSLDLLDIAVEFGGNLDLFDSFGETALSLAIRVERDDIISVLIANQARIDYYIEDCHSVVHYAARKNNVELLKEIQAAGHDLSNNHCHGWDCLKTPLEVALQVKSNESALFLFNHNAPYCHFRLNKIFNDAGKEEDYEHMFFVSEIMKVYK